MKLSIRLNQQAVIIWYLTSKIRANRVAHSVLYIIPHFQKTWPRFFIIPSKQKFITKALRGGRLLMLSSKTTRSPAVFERSFKRNSREKEDTIEEGEKKSEESTNSGDDQTRLRFATENSSCFAFPRETRRRNNHRKSRSRPRNDFSSACNGNIKA